MDTRHNYCFIAKDRSSKLDIHIDYRQEIAAVVT